MVHDCAGDTRRSDADVGVETSWSVGVSATCPNEDDDENVDVDGDTNDILTLGAAATGDDADAAREATT